MKNVNRFLGRRWMVYAIVFLLSTVVSAKALAGENTSESGIEASTCLCNYDGDEAITLKDLYIFAKDFGMPNYDPNGSLASDVDNDGDVDGADFAGFAAGFGQTGCDLWSGGTVVYVVDNPPPGSPVHFRELADAVSYLSGNVMSGEIGKVVVQTDRQLSLAGLSFGFDLKILVDDGYEGKIIGSGAEPLVVNAAGGFNLTGFSVSNSGGMVINAQRRLELVANRLPLNVSVNIDGAAGKVTPDESDGSGGLTLGPPEAAGAPLAVGSRIFNNELGELQLNFNRAVSSGFYGIEKNAGFGVNIGGNGALDGNVKLHFGENEIGDWGMNLDIQGMAKLSLVNHPALSHLQLNSDIASGTPSLDFSGNTSATAEVFLGGLGSVTFKLSSEVYNQKVDFNFDVQAIKLNSIRGKYTQMGIVLLDTLTRFNWQDLGSSTFGRFSFTALESDTATITAVLEKVQFNGDFKAALDGEISWIFGEKSTLHAFGIMELYGNLKNLRGTKANFKFGLMLQVKDVGLGLTASFQNAGFEDGSLYILGDYNFGITLTVFDSIFGGGQKESGSKAGIIVYGPLSLPGGQRTTIRQTGLEEGATPSDAGTGQILIRGAQLLNTTAWIEIVEMACPVIIEGCAITARPNAVHLERVIGPITIQNNSTIAGGGINILECSGPLTVSHNANIATDIPNRRGALALANIPTDFSITDNTFTAEGTGVSIWETGSVSFERNTIIAPVALDVEGAAGLVVSDCHINGQATGIHIRRATGPVIIQNNTDGIAGGIDMEDCSESVMLYNNKITYDIPGYDAAIYIKRTGSPSIIGNIIKSLTTGIWMSDTGSHTMTINKITAPKAIFVDGETRLTASDNVIAGNVEVAARLALSGNEFSNTSIMDLSEGLLNDPVPNNSGLDPYKIWTRIDWDGNGCCDYPPDRNEKDENGKCRCEGVAPPG